MTPVGMTEIAAHYGVRFDTVKNWRRRYPNFPQPRWTVGGRPAWNLEDIDTWHRNRGPHTLTPEQDQP